MKARPPSIEPLLQPNECLIWSYFVTDVQLNKNFMMLRRHTLYLVAASVIFSVLIVWRTYPSIFGTDISNNERWLNTVILLTVLVGVSWLIKSIFKNDNSKNQDDERRFYAISNKRMFATDLEGKLLDEMKATEIEFIIDLNNDEELLVSRVNDRECTNGFFFHTLEDRESAISAIRQLKPEGLMP